MWLECLAISIWIRLVFQIELKSEIIFNRCGKSAEQSRTSTNQEGVRTDHPKQLWVFDYNPEDVIGSGIDLKLHPSIVFQIVFQKRQRVM